MFCTKYIYIFHVMLPCHNSEAEIFCLDFRWPGILGVRISESQMFFRNLLLPTFWVSEFRKPKCVFAIFYYPYFRCPNFGNPNFRQNPSVMLCCYYHIPHTMRQTVEIRISSTVSRNFGRIVRKSKKFHTNNPNIVKTCRN